MRVKGHSISGVFVFLLLGVFAVFGTVLVLLGSQMYRSTVACTQAHNQTRILQSFARHAIRAEDSYGAVSVKELGGCTVLCIADERDEDSYETRIYVHDGALRELYAQRSEEFVPERGDAICAASAMEVSIDGGRLTLSIDDADGVRSEVVIALYGQGVSYAA